MAAVRVLAIGGMAALAGACSLTTSLAGLSGGEAAPDAGGTQGGNEAGTTIPAPADAAPSETTFCAQHPTPLICADFGTDRPYDWGWVSTTLTGGGVLLDDAGVLRATTPAVTTASSAAAFLSYPLPKGGAQVHFEGRIRALELSGGALTPFSITQTGDTYRGMILYVQDGSAEVQEEADAPQSTWAKRPLSTGTTVGRWQAYAFDFSFDTPTPSLTVSVDGEVLLDVSELNFPWRADGLELQVGVVHSLTKDEAAYEIDNIMVDVR
jgi:hypothetical protein